MVIETSIGRRRRRSLGRARIRRHRGAAYALARIVALLAARSGRAAALVALPESPLLRRAPQHQQQQHCCSPYRRASGSSFPSSPSSSASPSSTSTTALGAFWSRGSDADGSTSVASSSSSSSSSSASRRRSGNILWRKLGRRDGTDDVSSSSSDGGGGRVRGRTSMASPPKKKDEGGNGGRRGRHRALSVHTDSSAASYSSERYILSASYLSELCPSFDGSRRTIAATTNNDNNKFAEECVLDADFYESYGALERGRASYDRHIERKRDRIARLLGDIAGDVASKGEKDDGTVASGVVVDGSAPAPDVDSTRRKRKIWWPLPESKKAASIERARRRHLQKVVAASAATTTTSQAGRIVEAALDEFVSRHALHTLNLKFDASDGVLGDAAQDRNVVEERLLPPRLRPHHHNSSPPPNASSRIGLGPASQVMPLLSLLACGEVPPVRATFDRLSFPSLALSGGGSLAARSVSINSLKLLAPGVLCRLLPLRRFRDPFELTAEDCVFTQEDVRNSRLMRDGLSTLLDRILKRVLEGAHEAVVGDAIVAVTGDSEASRRAAAAAVKDFVRVNVTGVDIVDYADMISCTGIIATEADHPDVPFTVRTGLSSSHGGRVLNFPQMEMVLNPSSPVLPVVLPLHVWHPVDLDVGDDARIDEVRIDGRRGALRVNMRAVVTPGGKRKTKRRRENKESGGKKNKSVGGKGDGTRTADEEEVADVVVGGARPVSAPQMRARYSCDIGEWLTNVGRFSL